MKINYFIFPIIDFHNITKEGHFNPVGTGSLWFTECINSIRSLPWYQILRSCSALSNCGLVKQLIVKLFWIVAKEITFEYMLIDSNCRQAPKFGYQGALFHMCTSNAIHEDQSLGTPKCIHDRTIRYSELNPKTVTWIFR